MQHSNSWKNTIFASVNIHFRLNKQSTFDLCSEIKLFIFMTHHKKLFSEEVRRKILFFFLPPNVFSTLSAEWAIKIWPSNKILSGVRFQLPSTKRRFLVRFQKRTSISCSLQFVVQKNIDISILFVSLKNSEDNSVLFCAKTLSKFTKPHEKHMKNACHKRTCQVDFDSWQHLAPWLSTPWHSGEENFSLFGHSKIK